MSNYFTLDRSIERGTQMELPGEFAIYKLTFPQPYVLLALRTRADYVYSLRH